MKKLLILSMFLLASLAQAQVYTSVNRNIVVPSQVCAGSSRCNIIGTAAAFHLLTWYAVGTLSACSVQVDSSADGITWNSGDIIATQTCTSDGTLLSSSHVVNYVRVNVTAITPSGGGSLTVNLNGFATNSTGNLTGSLTSPRIPFAASASVLSDDANLNWDNTNKRVLIGASTPPSIFTTLGGGLQWYQTGASTIGGVLATFDNTSANGSQLIMYHVHGTKTVPIVTPQGSNLAYVTFGGYDGSTRASGARITSQASALWTTGKHSADIQVQAVPAGSTTIAEVFRFNVNTDEGSPNGNASLLDLLFPAAHGISFSATTAFSTSDTFISRSGAGVVAIGTAGQTAGDTTGKLKAAAYMAVGTKFTQDTGCGTIVTSSGGATAGKFTTVGSTSCTTVITMGNAATAPNGWDCHALDLTTVGDVTNPHQTASSATTATIATGTIVANDVIQFSCIGY